MVAVAEKFVGEEVILYMTEGVLESEDKCECVVGVTDVKVPSIEDVAFKVSEVQLDGDSSVVIATLCECVVRRDLVSVV